MEAYLECWSQVGAARVAGYKSPEKVGWKIFSLPQVQAAIAVRMSEAAMKADEVMARLAEQARANIAAFVRVDVDEDGLQVIVLDDEAIRTHGHLVKRVTNGKFGVGLELHDSQAALITIARHLGLLRDRLELSGQVSTGGAELDLSRLSEEELATLEAIIGRAAAQPTGD